MHIACILHIDIAAICNGPPEVHCRYCRIRGQQVHLLLQNRRVLHTKTYRDGQQSMLGCFLDCTALLPSSFNSFRARAPPTRPSFPPQMPTSFEGRRVADTALHVVVVLWRICRGICTQWQWAMASRVNTTLVRNSPPTAIDRSPEW